MVRYFMGTIFEKGLQVGGRIRDKFLKFFEFFTVFIYLGYLSLDFESIVKYLLDREIISLPDLQIFRFRTRITYKIL